MRRRSHHHAHRLPPRSQRRGSSQRARAASRRRASPPLRPAICADPKSKSSTSRFADALDVECVQNRRSAEVYKHLLVATDGSRLSGKAVTHAIALAQALKAQLTAFYASPDYPMPAYADGVAYEPLSKKQYEEMAAKEAQKILSTVKLKAEAGGVECNLLHTIANAPWEAILAAAKKARCDAIVMASHGRRGVSALLLGSETQKVLTHSKLPVIVVR